MLSRFFKGKNIQLMTFTKESPKLSKSTSFGGVPVYNEDLEFHWPQCSECSENMQYLGKIAEENPDLPFAFVKDILVSRQEEAAEEYEFG